ncbi:MAG TPA: hypothetical protein PKX58_06925, partial [Flexilinea sp.]|nr:hypothetical protein [Flexilinea sp.]
MRIGNTPAITVNCLKFVRSALETCTPIFLLYIWFFQPVDVLKRNSAGEIFELLCQTVDGIAIILYLVTTELRCVQI